MKDRKSKKETVKRITRLIESNFTNNAWEVIGTYDCQPHGYDQSSVPKEFLDMKADVRGFLNSLRSRVKREIGTADDLKWVVGYGERRHVWYALIEGPGVTGKMIRDSWNKGDVTTLPFRCRCRNPENTARYFCVTFEQEQGRWWSHSRNLLGK